MPRTIAFLHTAQSNAELFETAVQSQPIERRHVVRDDLLARAVSAGELTAEVREDTRCLLRSLAEDADVVLLTCSTLGPAADDLGDPRVMRIDRALAEAAVAVGKSIKALCTVPSTLGPTNNLFQVVAAGTSVAVDVELIDGAWAHFEQGDLQAYFAAIAQAADRLAQDDTIIVFAQASMAPAADLCREAAPMTSLEVALKVR